MIHIDFACETMRQHSGKKREKIATASEMDIRYDYFETDISLSIESQWSERFAAVPIVDFMFCLLLTVRAAREGREGRISFTENDMTVGIIPTGGRLELVRSWDPRVGSCEVDDFLSQASSFVSEGLECILEKYPEFRSNPTYLKLSL